MEGSLGLDEVQQYRVKITYVGISEKSFSSTLEAHDLRGAEEQSSAVTAADCELRAHGALQGWRCPW